MYLKNSHEGLGKRAMSYKSLLHIPPQLRWFFRTRLCHRFHLLILYYVVVCKCVFCQHFTFSSTAFLGCFNKTTIRTPYQMVRRIERGHNLPLQPPDDLIHDFRPRPIPSVPTASVTKSSSGAWKKRIRKKATKSGIGSSTGSIPNASPSTIPSSAFNSK